MDALISWLVNESEDVQVILYFALLLVLVVTEYLVAFRCLKRGRRWVANFFLTGLAIVTMLLLPITFITAAAYAADTGWGLFNSLQIHWVLLGLLTLLLRGFISFLTHWLAHTVPLFWRVHRVHHLDTEMDVSTTVRFHPFEFLINVLVGVPIVLLFGFPVWGLMLYELLDVIVTLVSHANISFPRRLENVLRYILVTPDLHRVHHSSRQPETDSNFSAVFPIWDIVFGTFRTRTQETPLEMELGLEEVRDDRTNSIGWLLKSPFRDLKEGAD